MNEVLGVGQVQWAFGKLVGGQIREYLYNFGDLKVRNKNSWGYYNNF